METKYYLLIAFLVLWGGGMLWGFFVVINHLRKKNRVRKVLNEVGFRPISGNLAICERVKEIALRTVCRDLWDGSVTGEANSTLNVDVKDNSIKIEQSLQPDDSVLPRPIGFKEKIRLLSRAFVLKKIQYSSDNNIEAFYAETLDTEIIKFFRNRKEKRSSGGWVLCVSGKTKYPVKMIVRPKFTGSAKLLVNLAHKIADVKPVSAGGLLPKFVEAFEVSVGCFDGELPKIDTDTQLKILDARDFFPQQTTLTLSPDGLWLSGSIWPDLDKFKKLVSFCYSLNQ